MNADVLNAIAAGASALMSFGALVVALFALRTSNKMSGIDAVRLHSELRPTLEFNVLPYRMKEKRYLRLTLVGPQTVTLPFTVEVGAAIMDRGGCIIYSAKKSEYDPEIHGAEVRWITEDGVPDIPNPGAAWELSRLHVGEDRVLTVHSFPDGTEDCTIKIVAWVQLKDYEPWRIYLSAPIEPPGE